MVVSASENGCDCPQIGYDAEFGGNISSPKFPNSYCKGMHCLYYIYNEDHMYSVNLTVNSVRLARGDTLTIREGEAFSGRQRQIFG